MRSTGKRRGRQMTLESLEAKIEKAQERVVMTRKASEEAERELKELLEKRDAIRKDDLYRLFLDSKWTYEQIVKMMSSEPPVED